MLRDTIVSAEMRPRSVMMSSVTPSLKYSCSASPLMLMKGMMRTVGFAGEEAAAAEAFLGASAGNGTARGRLVATVDKPLHVGEERDPHFVFVAALPVREIGGLGEFEHDRPVAGLDHDRDKRFVAVTDRRFRAHPAGFDGPFRPQDNDGLLLPSAPSR